MDAVEVGTLVVGTTVRLHIYSTCNTRGWVDIENPRFDPG